VALDAAKGLKTLAELGIGIQGTPESDLGVEEATAAERARDLCGPTSKRPKTEEELTAPLYEEIGRLKMDVKWLEKKG